MAGRSNMERLEALIARFPEAERVDVEAWGDHPTFRVRNKNFVFSDDAATSLSFKLSTDEAEAVIATDPRAEPAGYGLGRHGWVAYDLEPGVGEERWREVAEWIETSYLLVAPKTLGRRLLADPPASHDPEA